MMRWANCLPLLRQERHRSFVRAQHFSTNDFQPMPTATTPIADTHRQRFSNDADSNDTDHQYMRNATRTSSLKDFVMNEYALEHIRI